jgi:hypothetical protein
VRSNVNHTPTRIAPQTAVDLALHAYEFFIGPFLRVHLEIVDLNVAPDRDPRSRGSVLGNQGVLGAALGSSTPPPAMGDPSAYMQPNAPPLRPSTGEPPPGAGAMAPLPSLPGIAPLPSLDPGLARSAGGMKGPPGYGPSPHAPPGPPQYGSPAGGPSPAAGHNPSAGFVGTGHLALDTEALALQGLRELASSLVPGVPLETTGDVARLITKLHDAVEVFCRCFIPLREGYAQFVSSMDLQRAAMQRSMNRSRGYVALEMANNPGAVASALLNWREPSFDAPKAVEGIFADLMIHQVALLDGVMKGVRALLDELSPEQMEQALATREPRGPLGLQLAIGRYKALWDLYRERFEQLSDEKQAFAHIFGPEFTEAYREYRQRR